MDCEGSHYQPHLAFQTNLRTLRGHMKGFKFGYDIVMTSQERFCYLLTLQSVNSTILLGR